MAAKIRKASSPEAEKPESDDDEQQNAVEAESLHSQLHEVVRDEVALRHPIVSPSRDICNLVNANKLSSLSVGMLKEICKSLGLNVDDINVLYESLRSTFYALLLLFSHNQIFPV